jgi:hypothetical protein
MVVKVALTIIEKTDHGAENILNQERKSITKMKKTASNIVWVITWKRWRGACMTHRRDEDCISWHADPLLGNDYERSSYTTALAK